MNRSLAAFDIACLTLPGAGAAAQTEAPLINLRNTDPRPSVRILSARLRR